MDERINYPKPESEIDPPGPYSDKSPRAAEERAQAELYASMEAVIKKQEFEMLGSKGEFMKPQEEKRRDIINPLPEIHLSVTELHDGGKNASGKIHINYSFRSIPENPLFFDNFRGEIDGVEALVTRIQLYLYSKRVYIATENRVIGQKPERHIAPERGSNGKNGKKGRG